MSKERAGLFALLGLTGLTLGGIALASASSKKPAPGGFPPPPAPRPDWSGCGEPPDYCQPRPRFKCGDTVKYSGTGNTAPIPHGKELGPNIVQRIKDVSVDGLIFTVTGRGWGTTAATGPGLWTYELKAPAGAPLSSTNTEEANLELVTSTVVKQVAAVLAPTATLAAAPVVKAVVAPVTAKQEAAMNLPLYPQGLVVSKGSVKGVVISISKRDETYYYKVEAGIGFITQDYTGSESYVMNMLAEKTGQQAYGFAFPAGVTLQMKKLKVAIKERKLDGGKMAYVTDTLGVISEPELILKLYQAQKG